MLEHNLIEATKKFVKNVLDNDSSHDWWHVYRVWQMATYIAKKEGANLFIVEMVALLHDVDDWKFQNNKNTTRKWLEDCKISEEIQKNILTIIHDISFKGANTVAIPLSLEGKILQDADRLDAIGAIGIARTFAYGGYKNREIYNPSVPPTMHIDFEEYKNHQGTTINHFYEKLLLLKDRMNTNTAKKIAKNRHIFMEKFLAQFLGEWNFADDLG